MGGDDSQKLLPRRGLHSSAGLKPPAYYAPDLLNVGYYKSLLLKVEGFPCP